MGSDARTAEANGTEIATSTAVWSRSATDAMTMRIPLEKAATRIDRRGASPAFAAWLYNEGPTTASAGLPSSPAAGSTCLPSC